MTIRVAAFAAIGIGAANLAMGQGPIREGIRRTGEAAANVTRGVVEGTADVARGVGQAAAGTLRATGDALTPNTPYQARLGANLSAADQSRDARWRFARHNGEWWYYSPQNEWMYHRGGDWQQFSQDSFQPMNQGQQFAQDQQFIEGQQYSSGYRGVEQDQGQISQDQGFHQQVRHDRYGRAFICENGRPVYLTEGQLQGQTYDQAQVSPTPAQPQEYGVARQNLDQQAAPPQPAQGEIRQGQAVQPASPAPSASAEVGGEADVSSAPAGSETGTQAQGEPTAPREINNNPTPQTQGATENPSQ